MGTSNIIVYVPPALFSIVALAFFLLWHLKITTSWHWSAGFAQTAAGFVLSTFSIEPSFDAFASGLVFIGAAYCYGSGILAHFGAPTIRVERTLFAVAYTLALAYLVFVKESLVWQLFLTDAGFAFLFSMALCVVVRKASRPVDKALVFTSAIVVLDTLARTIFFTFFTTASDDFADFADSAYNLAVHVTTITVCMLFPFIALGAIASAAVERHRDASERDPLTGLFNRRGFEQAIERGLKSTIPWGAVVVCDIDYFKRINDNYGHAIGDKVIVALARDLRHIVGADGYVARVGGEEFVAFLPAAAPQDLYSIAQRLRHSFAERDWRGEGISDRITVSCGVSAVQSEERALDKAISRADRALYAAKAAGRNQVVVDGAYHAPIPSGETRSDHLFPSSVRA
ncbi:GGDEF domain-containing protein [Sinorhizobium garamanticum]|uniref:diguanylate cyclase n=1 Tax=Sinorhizobium garamanticum TaxID=680247 RepID=A0ABY8DI73_9HYPH|nr:GGDEF domain-containing protein [Sinorhizobium garamanticum]WEX90594.1 GGDEF domain-containing protein [Sinorhizobium garamanticum]